MYEDHTIAVVVPAYNEEESVGAVLESFPSFVDRAYVVDDGSTDDTWAEIQEKAVGVNEQHEGHFDQLVVPIQHEENRGVGGAIKTGYLHARKEGIDVTTVMAGDDQMDPELLEQYVDPVVAGEADYTKGNRFLHEDIEEMPRFRYVGNVMLSLLTKIASGYWSIGDPQNGYTAISLAALEAIELEEMYEYYGYCNDLLVKLNVAGMRVMDVPHSSEYLYDEDWSSHIRYGDYIPRVSTMLLRNFVWRLGTRARTLYPPALLYAAASCVGLFALFAAVRSGGDGESASALVTSVLLALLGTVADVNEGRQLGRRADDDRGTDA